MKYALVTLAILGLVCTVAFAADDPVPLNTSTNSAALRSNDTPSFYRIYDDAASMDEIRVPPRPRRRRDIESRSERFDYEFDRPRRRPRRRRRRDDDDDDDCCPCPCPCPCPSCSRRNRRRRFDTGDCCGGMDPNCPICHGDPSRFERYMRDREFPDYPSSRRRRSRFPRRRDFSSEDDMGGCRHCA